MAGDMAAWLTNDNDMAGDLSSDPPMWRLDGWCTSLTHHSVAARRMTLMSHSQYGDVMGDVSVWLTNEDDMTGNKRLIACLPNYGGHDRWYERLTISNDSWIVTIQIFLENTSNADMIQFEGEAEL